MLETFAGLGDGWDKRARMKSKCENSGETPLSSPSHLLPEMREAFLSKTYNFRVQDMVHVSKRLCLKILPQALSATSPPFSLPSSFILYQGDA